MFGVLKEANNSIVITTHTLQCLSALVKICTHTCRTDTNILAMCMHITTPKYTVHTLIHTQKHVHLSWYRLSQTHTHTLQTHWYLVIQIDMHSNRLNLNPISIVFFSIVQWHRHNPTFSSVVPPFVYVCVCMCACFGGHGRVRLTLTVTPPWLLLHCLSWIPKIGAIWLH